LQAACDKDDVTRAAVAEIVAYGRDRRSWLAFCAGVEHAYHVRDAIRAHGITCETITGDTTSDRRDP
jgi:DNA repair protein RadD